jgi:membrane protein YqaA with SNARE-associated domain
LITGLVSLFIGSLLASTILPGGVEVLLYYLFQSGEYSWISLLVVSTIGNTAGGVITFFMGWLIHSGLSGTAWHQRIEKLFALDDKSLARVEKWGIPMLFFSWMPIIGDPLCLAGGYLRLPLWKSIFMIFLGKFARYCVLLWLYTQPWAAAPI